MATNSRMHWLILFLCLFSGVAKADLCNRSPAEVQVAFRDPKHRISFRNHGGLMNGGVCWWHSRLQRASIYLTQFSPQKARPTASEAKQLVHQLAQMKSVVEIPGYQNFHSFSTDFRSIIQAELDRWQREDGFIRQQWLRGLYGRSSMPADALAKRMDTVFQKFKSHDPGLWVMAQIKGITSHALLFMDMIPAANGYQIHYIDSNYPADLKTMDYQSGDESISEYHMVPYVGFNHDYDLIHRAISKYCTR